MRAKFNWMNFSLVGECKYVNNVRIFRDSAYLLRELNFFQWGNYPSLFLLFFYYNEIYVYSLKNSFLLKKMKIAEVQSYHAFLLPCFYFIQYKVGYSAWITFELEILKCQKWSIKFILLLAKPILPWGSFLGIIL